MKMKYTIVSGSTRPKSQSLKVAKYVADQLKSTYQDVDLYLLDLANNPLPFWDEGLWEGQEQWHESWLDVSKNINDSDAIIIITPEWDGMATPSIKNFFQLCSHGELFHKPGLLISVSAGMGGTYPIAELRMSSYKNTKLCYIPEHIIIRQVKEVLNDLSTSTNDSDQSIRERIDYVLGVLNTYATYHQLIRQDSRIDINKYTYGM